MPILVVTDSDYTANPFGCYLTEILRGEGLVEFEQIGRASLSRPENASCLSSSMVVLLAEMELNDKEQRLLRDYVANGGLLIAMRPHPGMSDLFGIEVGQAGPERLLQHFVIDIHRTPCKGLANSPLQYHGAADKYTLKEAVALASLCDGSRGPTSDPAVTMNRHGKGIAVAFAFDMAKNVVLIRQGNPEWKNTKGDNVAGYRTRDMFARKDGRTWYDPKCLAVPQADENQRFLANIILGLADEPLPRMWYLPDMHKTMMVNAGDCEANYGPEIKPVLDACASYGGYFTAYLMERGIQLTTAEEEAAWRAEGHEVGVHVYGDGKDGAGAYEPLRKAYGTIVGNLRKKFGHGSLTARNHTLDWTGWVDMAAIEAEFGTQMDMNYIHRIPDADPRTHYGYATGSGLPQRFIDEKGRLLPIYQATVHWPDGLFVYADLSPEESMGLIRKMFEESKQEHYAALVAGIHPIRFNGMGGRDKITPVWPHLAWKYCRDNGIPSWSAEMLLEFVKARNGARFDNINWQIDKKQNIAELSFDFYTPTNDQKLTVMIPEKWGNKTLQSITTDGKEVHFKRDIIKGLRYGMFTITGQACIDAMYKFPLP